MLFKPGIALDLTAAKYLLERVEQSKRGGYTCVGTERYVKANNTDLEDYDSTIASNYLLYIDAHNVYGLDMGQYLPYSDIKINMDISYDDVSNTSYESDIGYMVEVDISFPKQVHEVLKHFVPCPENIIPETESFSEYQKELQVLAHANNKN